MLSRGAETSEVQQHAAPAFQILNLPKSTSSPSHTKSSLTSKKSPLTSPLSHSSRTHQNIAFLTTSPCTSLPVIAFFQILNLVQVNNHHLGTWRAHTPSRNLPQFPSTRLTPRMPPEQRSSVLSSTRVNTHNEATTKACLPPRSLPIPSTRLTPLKCCPGSVPHFYNILSSQHP